MGEVLLMTFTGKGLVCCFVQTVDGGGLGALTDSRGF